MSAPRRRRRWPPALSATGLGKYLAIAALSARQRLEERAALWGRVLFYFIILFIFARLWAALLGAPSSGHGPGASRFVWYLAVTEWIMLSQPLLHFDIEAEIRAGDVGHQLSRPVSYVAAKLAENAGEVAIRLLVLGASGLIFARLLAGEWPEPGALLLAALAGVVSSAVMSLAYAAIGLSALWLYDTTSLYLIWQKLCFVLGGLMLPLSIYPPWLRVIAAHSPFAALLFGPGQLVLDATPSLALDSALGLVGWGLCFTLLLVALERRAVRAVTRNGG